MAMSAESMANRILGKFESVGFESCTENKNLLKILCAGIVEEIVANAEVFDGICKDNGPIKDAKVK